jgi:hypothetical protein
LFEQKLNSSRHTLLASLRDWFLVLSFIPGGYS